MLKQFAALVLIMAAMTGSRACFVGALGLSGTALVLTAMWTH